MQTLTVGELEEILSKITDKSLPVVMAEGHDHWGTVYNAIEFVHTQQAAIMGPKTGTLHTAVILS
jgi:hypothetical protein